MRYAAAMALTATLYRLQLELSDVDRGVYQTLDVRLARHPSESAAFMTTRALAYALAYEDGITFGRGLSTAEDPALSTRDLQGILTTWIDVGCPSAERLHRASKAARRVIVFTAEIGTLLRELRGRVIHRAEELEIYSLTPKLVDAVGAATGRTSSWSVLRTEGQLYVTVDGQQHEGEVVRHLLTEER